MDIEHSTIKSALQILAAKTSFDKNYLGWVINQYMNAYNYTEDQLASILQCDLESVVKLKLCSMPRESTLVGDVRTIAEYANCNNLALLRIIREANAVEGMKSEENDEGKGFLMAARDFWGDDEEPK